MDELAVGRGRVDRLLVGASRWRWFGGFGRLLVGRFCGHGGDAGVHILLQNAFEPGCKDRVGDRMWAMAGS